jgi:TolB protein
MTRRTALRRLALTTALVALLPAAGRLSEPAQAGFPGFNAMIAFSTTEGATDIKTVDGNKAIVKLFRNSTMPAWSPNGKNIAFAARPDGQFDIYAKSGDEDAKQLTSSPGVDTDPAWSPDGKKIVFVSDRPPHIGNLELYVMNADGTGVLRLTDDPGADENPSWGTTGRIAYDNDAAGDHELFTMNPDGSGRAQITDNGSDDILPNWSPDGTRIVYSGNPEPDGYFDIYTANPDGTDRTRLTNDPALDYEPAWSPDGTKIVFVSFRVAAQPRLFVTDVQGTVEEMLIDTDAARPDWQPKLFELKQRIGSVKVDAHGTFATVSWHQTLPGKKARVELWEGKKPDGKVKLQGKTVADATKDWSIKITHLRPGTTYQLYVVTGVGGDPVERKHPGGLKTLRRTVEIVFTGVKVHDDSDPSSCGEFSFDFVVDGQLRAPFPDEVICDGETWNAPNVKFALKDVQSDTVTVKVLAVDNDLSPTDEVPKWENGASKYDGEWAERAILIDVGPKGFTSDVLPSSASEGENYLVFDRKLELKNCDGCPRLTWSFNYGVDYE